MFLHGFVKGSVRLFLVKILLNSPCALIMFCFLLLVSRGRACISIPRPGVSKKGFFFFFFFPCVGFHSLYALSDYLVTDWTGHSTNNPRWLTQPILLFESLQFLKRVLKMSVLSYLHTEFCGVCVTQEKAKWPRQ